jgi:hypothetical protein
MTELFGRLLFVTKNEVGTVNWTFAVLSNVDAYTLTFLRVALDEYIEEYQSNLSGKASSKALAPYSPFPRQSKR